MQVTRRDFGEDFKWGVSTAAYQIEGAYDTDGKGESIWDVFPMQKGKIYKNQHAKISCDFYNRYIQDLILMQSLEYSQLWFSISWSRLMPQGVGKINCKGVDFYNRVIDFCLELDIEPWITLYHWDLPYELEKKGGWTNREIINWFSDYVAFCIQKFGDRVKHWMVLNEPMVFTVQVIFWYSCAWEKRAFIIFCSGASCCNVPGEGGRIARSIRNDLKIGTTFSCSHIEPAYKLRSRYSCSNKSRCIAEQDFH